MYGNLIEEGSVFEEQFLPAPVFALSTATDAKVGAPDTQPGASQHSEDWHRGAWYRGFKSQSRRHHVTAPEGFSEQRLDTLILETHKATTAFFDRSLLVNGGTLSLIITVGSTALLTSQHPLALDAGLRQRILVGCYLLALSFAFCLLHNYLKLPGMATALSYSLLRA